MKYGIITLAILLTTGCQAPEETAVKAATVDSCPFSYMVKNGADAGQTGRTNYLCSMVGSYYFGFYSDNTVASQMMTYPSATVFDTTYSSTLCKLTLSVGGVAKFELTNPVVNGNNELIGFHHDCLYCGGHDDASCTLVAGSI